MHEPSQEMRRMDLAIPSDSVMTRSLPLQKHHLQIQKNPVIPLQSESPLRLVIRCAAVINSRLVEVVVKVPVDPPKLDETQSENGMILWTKTFEVWAMTWPKKNWILAKYSSLMLDPPDLCCVNIEEQPFPIFERNEITDLVYHNATAAENGMLSLRIVRLNAMGPRRAYRPSESEPMVVANLDVRTATMSYLKIETRYDARKEVPDVDALHMRMVIPNLVGIPPILENGVSQIVSFERDSDVVESSVATLMRVEPIVIDEETLMHFDF